MSTTKYTDKLMKTAPQCGVVPGVPAVISQMVDGTLPADKFRNLVIQDIIIDQHWKKFLAVLISRIPSKFQTMGGHTPTEFLAAQILNHDKHKINDKFCHQLKIKRDEIQPTLVTKAVCDFLMSTVYNKTYKDALIILLASSRCIPEKMFTSPNPMYNEWLQTHVKSVNVIASWAVSAINEIREEDDVNHKHQQLFNFATKYENTFWESIDQPQLYNWPC